MSLEKCVERAAEVIAETIFESLQELDTDALQRASFEQDSDYYEFTWRDGAVEKIKPYIETYCYRHGVVKELIEAVTEDQTTHTTRVLNALAAFDKD